MEGTKKNILRNFSTKRNPYTTKAAIAGYVFACIMIFIKVVLPYFMELKKEVDITWTNIIWLVVGSTVLAFFNEKYFGEVFGLSKAIVRKQNGIDKKED